MSHFLEIVFENYQRNGEKVLVFSIKNNFFEHEMQTELICTFIINII